MIRGRLVDDKFYCVNCYRKLNQTLNLYPNSGLNYQYQTLYPILNLSSKSNANPDLNSKSNGTT